MDFIPPTSGTSCRGQAPDRSASACASLLRAQRRPAQCDGNCVGLHVQSPKGVIRAIPHVSISSNAHETLVSHIGGIIAHQTPSIPMWTLDFTNRRSKNTSDISRRNKEQIKTRPSPCRRSISPFCKQPLKTHLRYQRLRSKPQIKISHSPCGRSIWQAAA